MRSNLLPTLHTLLSATIAAATLAGHTPSPTILKTASTLPWSARQPVSPSMNPSSRPTTPISPLLPASFQPFWASHAAIVM
ncbi:hypothetical protein C8035_v011292 [Colletotrichum spinosum]|uniref:Uncharacterized protein n=1 Tax=Colletotrichum spinosum TaxID=1347390 RepID=A0A4R8PUE7_9PEZI|nr:hypothetical protein C8035_v011292 [Colletotrichum spinosum]